MSERDIKGYITVLHEALTATARADNAGSVELLALDAGVKLVEGALVDLNRIADAIERIADRRR